MNKGGKFLNKLNCGAASVGKYNKVIKYYQLSSYRKSATVKSFQADVSNLSPSLERQSHRNWPHMPV